MSKLIVKGQAWITDNKLVQEQIIMENGNTYNSIETIIEDIDQDLLSDKGVGKYKVGEKKAGYFYWETEVSEFNNPENYITIPFECPNPPTEGVIKEIESLNFEPGSNDGEYLEYWKKKIKAARENSEKMASIQRKEIIFPGTTYYDKTTKELVQTEDTVIKNSDLSDMANLLSTLV